MHCSQNPSFWDLVGLGNWTWTRVWQFEGSGAFWCFNAYILNVSRFLEHERCNIFFQITITLNPIIIHKLWEKIFHQSWWEIKVRRPRHGNDSIFPHTLQTAMASLRWGRSCIPKPEIRSCWASLCLWAGDVTPWRCGGKWRPLLVCAEPRSRVSSHRSQTRSRSQRHQARPLTAVTETDAGPVHWTLDKHTSIIIFLNLLGAFDTATMCSLEIIYKVLLTNSDHLTEFFYVI